MFVVRRSDHNPIIKPYLAHPWEAHATFNWSPIKKGKETHVVYRAMIKPGVLSHPNFSVSSIGYAKSTDGFHYRGHRQLVAPMEKWERYGCEDPRITKLNGFYYIFYTALSDYPFNADNIKVAVAKTKDFKKITERHLVTPFNAKAMVLFPEKINGRFAALLSVNTDRPPSSIAYASFEKEGDIWNEELWEEWYENLDEHTLPVQRDADERVELGTVPIKTKYGWLVFYGNIQHHSTDPAFGVNAMLLDLKDPRKILGRTKTPLLVPEVSYEKFGHVPNVIWPSGAMVVGKKVEIFYGAADTTCCKASVSLKDLLDSLRPDVTSSEFKRFSNNPILSPKKENDWESRAVFNPAAVDIKGVAHIVYRAMSEDNTSVMGLALSKDGRNITKRFEKPIYTPRAPFEEKKNPGGNSGCEDPRITKIGKRYYMVYTAYDGVDSPKIAVTSINEKDFSNHKWDWTDPVIFSPTGVDDKDACIIPEKIQGKYVVLHRISPHICADMIKTLDFESEKITKCIQIIGPRPGMWDSKKVGISGPPIKTKKGWLLFYHGVDNKGAYRVGAVLLALKDPTVVLGRTTDFMLEPIMDYEKEGQIPNVVFPCGSVLRGDTILIYYGGGDSVVGGAEISLKRVLKALA